VCPLLVDLHIQPGFCRMTFRKEPHASLPFFPPMRLTRMNLAHDFEHVQDSRRLFADNLSNFDIVHEESCLCNIPESHYDALI
jgi:hypothetical protein